MRKYVAYYHVPSSEEEDCCHGYRGYQNLRRESKMILFGKPFHSVTDKRSQTNDCGENSVTIVTEKKIEDDASDSSSGETVDIEEKSLPLVEPPLQVNQSEEGHAAQCACPNCDEVLSRYAECSICLEPLQCCGPCVCPWCGGVWCARCSRRMTRCAWCRGALRTPATPCLALQRLINDLMLPCRNYRRGCTELLTANIRVKHEEECKFDTMVCPITATCCSVPFEELSAHLQSTHNIIAVYSQKIKILIENFQTKLKKTACCRTKYKIILLYQKSAFIIKVCIYNYHVKVEVMRRKLGHIADVKSETKKSDYCALIEFQSKALCTKSAILIENEAYSKKAEVQWSDVVMKAENDEAITIHVNIGKTDSDNVKEIAET
ncbi:E3 ubiquitin-protein ligase SINA-like 5 isoform X1 [Colias croceus]|uniref:E3 ubiquitin-protein ligase SINA-like 5 isoform X1 n=1 Tax=Colias crocea TaxID=72248 RepID=UPI001E27A413|nr:E3 ubiquitin-protein ligase SINA-like 5 isoform X1 [Colias croceus]